MGSQSFEDAFQALRGGAVFSKRKHAADMSLFHESLPQNQASPIGLSSQALAKEIDFFGTSTAPLKDSEDLKPKGSTKKKKQAKRSDGDSEGRGVSEAPQPVSLEAASLVRKQYRIKVCGGAGLPPAPLMCEDTWRGLEALGCPEGLLHRLPRLGLHSPTPIQRQALPALMQGFEVMCIAPTGSGKTLAFLLPIMAKLKGPAGSSSGGPRAVLLSPTRELALQTARVARTLMQDGGLSRRLKVMVLSKSNLGDSALTSSVDLLLATPLRLKGAVESGKVDLSQVEFLVLDEADKLFEMGFVEQIDAVVGACNHPGVQRCMFSATLPEAVEELGRSVMPAPLRVTVGERNTASSQISQRLLFVGQSEEGKLLAVTQLLRSGQLQPPALIFLDSKDRAQELYNELRYENLRVGAIHSGMSATKRSAVVDQFRAGEVWFLIATDLMARGVDFIGVKSVLNFDFPRSAITYIHRVGRTGRAGREGHAVTLFSQDDTPHLRSIANLIKQSGCPVEDWMLKLKKGHNRSSKGRVPSDEVAKDKSPNSSKKRKLENDLDQSKNPKKSGNKKEEKGTFSTIAKFDTNRRIKKQQMIEASKRRKLKNEESQKE